MGSRRMSNHETTTPAAVQGDHPHRVGCEGLCRVIGAVAEQPDEPLDHGEGEQSRGGNVPGEADEQGRDGEAQPIGPQRGRNRGEEEDPRARSLFGVREGQPPGRVARDGGLKEDRRESEGGDGGGVAQTRADVHAEELAAGQARSEVRADRGGAEAAVDAGGEDQRARRDDAYEEDRDGSAVGRDGLGQRIDRKGMAVDVDVGFRQPAMQPLRRPEHEGGHQGGDHDGDAGDDAVDDEVLSENPAVERAHAVAHGRGRGVSVHRRLPSG